MLSFLLIFPSIKGTSIWNQLVSFEGKLQTSDYVLTSSLRHTIKGNLSKTVHLPYDIILSLSTLIRVWSFRSTQKKE